MSIKSLKICTFNCKNFNGTLKIDYISSLLDKCDFLCLQEHHLFESEFYKFEELSVQSSVMCTATSAMDPTIFHRGRKFGGTAILWKANMKYTVNSIKTVSKRLSAVTVDLPNDTNIMITCVYMPCDEGFRGENLNQYNDILNEISVMSEMTNAYAICIAGDLNTDISRQNPQTEELLQFCNNENLWLFKNSDISLVDYTYESAIGSKSCIDHIVVSENLLDEAKSYYCLNELDNTSDHLPICAEFNVDCDYSNLQKSCNNERCKWSKATEDNIAMYKQCLNNNLDLYINSEMTNLYNCSDPHCNNVEHLLFLEDLYFAVVDACLQSAQQTIPNGNKTKHGKKNNMPGFNEYVREHRDTALQWHQLWKMQGKPRHGYVAEMRRVTRSRYHYKVKAVKQHNNVIRSEKMAQSLKTGNHKQLWQYVRLRKSKCLPSNVDGCNNPRMISELFADKYKKLYNSVGFDEGQLNDMQFRIKQTLNQDCLNRALFNIVHIKQAVGQLKNNKHDGNNGLVSDNIINGTDKLFEILTKLFNCMLTHGCSVNDMLLGTLTPIVKDRRAKLSSSDNFRSICLQNVLCKLMDLVILFKENESLCTSDMQFGFKSKSSTSLATSVFLETTDYYVRKGGNVYALALDATKAFDRVNYVKLFKLLESRNLNPVYVRFLIDNYVKQQLRVKYNGETSNWFNVSNGVKQGGVLSPTLFSVYIDNMLNIIKDNNLGCHIGDTCCGIIGYADDILLLSPTVQTLERMIRVCETYACDFDIKFNGKKSQLMVFGKCKGEINVRVNGEKLEVVNTMKYLGNVISNSVCDPMISNVKNDFTCKVNAFLGNFSEISSHVKNSLFQQYCLSLYGSTACMLDNIKVKELKIAWRKAIRRIWNLPYRTHSELLPLISKQLSIEYVMYKRFIKHFLSGLFHKNESVNFIFHSSLYYSSRLSNNFRYVMKLCGKSIKNVKDLTYVNEMYTFIDSVGHTSSQENMRIAEQICELCQRRDSFEDWILCKHEINDILTTLCTQ